jgi:integrase
VELAYVEGIERAKRPSRAPVVLTREEARRVLDRLTGAHRLMASLLYGSGLRVMECVRLRVKDVDFGYQQITVRDGKDEKDRRTLLPPSLAEPLWRQLARAKFLHEEDTERGYGRVYLPYALERKYPSAAADWCWQWVFPADRLSSDPRSGQVRRHHVSEDKLQEAVRRAVKLSGLAKRVSWPHLPPQLRHAPAGGRLRHPHDPGTARPRGRADHDDLHACVEQGRQGREKSARGMKV